MIARFVLFFVLISVLLSACKPAPAPIHTPTASPTTPTPATPAPTRAPKPTATSTQTAEWTPPGRVVEPREFEGKLIRLVSFKSEAGCCGSWVEVEVEGELAWTKVNSLSYHRSTLENNLHYFESEFSSWTVFEYAEGVFDEDMRGFWQANKYYDSSIEVWDSSVYYYPTDQDERVLSYWSDFRPYVNAHPFVVDGLLDTSPGREANVMLDYWWLTEWDWNAYTEVYELVYGYPPNPSSARTYTNFYGMAANRDKLGVPFTAAPPDATVLGCLPPEMVAENSRWTEEGLELLIDDFYVASNRGLVLTIGNTFFRVWLTPYDHYLAVAQDIPTWPSQISYRRNAPDGITMPSGLELYELCN